MTEPYRGAQGSGSQGSIVTERSWVSSHGFHDDRSPGGARPTHPSREKAAPWPRLTLNSCGVGGQHGEGKICPSVVNGNGEMDGNRGCVFLLADFVGDSRERELEGKAIDFDQASSTTCHSISLPDEIPDLTVAGYATVPSTGIMDEGCAGMFN